MQFACNFFSILCSLWIFLLTLHQQKQPTQATYNSENQSTKRHNREAGGLIKGARDTQCESLYLIVGYGKSEEHHIDSHTIHKVLASEWLLS